MDIGIQKLPDKIIPLMTDMADAHGCYIAIRLLQLELAEFSDDIHVGKVDGVIGKKTIAATNNVIKYHDSLFIRHLVNRRVNFYRSIVRNDPSKSALLNDWVNRAKSFLI